MSNLPSLKEARLRTKSSAKIIKEIDYITEELKDFGKGKYFKIITHGCQANVRDSETLRGLLKRMSYTETDDNNLCDLILVNTCAVREGAKEKVFGKLGALKHLKVKNPEMIIGLCGCMPQEETTVERIMKHYRYLDLVFGTHNLHHLPQLLQNAAANKKTVVEVFSNKTEIVENLPSVRDSKVKAFVNIMYGCDKFCTYCIVPYTRGKQRSRLKDDVIKEINQLVKDGYKEITLLGQNVNSYGNDLENGYTFYDLLIDVAKTGIDRIRFTTSHPFDFDERIIDLFNQYHNLMPYIHLPVQSGNDEILKKMGRKYTREKYLALINKIREKVPNCSFSTDIIVGFPNETEEQFIDTLKLVDQCNYDNVYTFIYSKKAGTPASSMKDEISYEEKVERLNRLNEVVAKNANRNALKYIGEVVEVLVDDISKKNDSYCGYTTTNKLVNIKCDSSYFGKIVKVKIIAAKTWNLIGEIVEK